MSDWKQNHQEYISKLNTQINVISKIVSLNTDGLVDDERRKKLLILQSKARILQKKLENNEFEIAIVGLEKAGKSTFANALMGNDILPSKDARCTYTSTSIRYGDDTATVEFFTWAEFTRSFMEKLQMLKIPHVETFSFETLNLQNYQQIFEQLDSNTKTLFGGTLNKDIEDILTYKENLKQLLGRPIESFSGSEKLASSYFKDFIQDPAYAIAVKEIVLRSSRLSAMQNAVIYDVPGFDSPTQIHKDQTIEKMKQADAIILIASAYKPSLTGPLVEIFRTEADYDGVKFGDKMFVFANMADKATTLAENMRIICEDLKKHRIMESKNIDSRIVSGSSRAKLESEGKISGNIAMTGLKAQGLSEDGIDAIKEKLESYNRKERFEILKVRVNKMQNDIIGLFGELLERKNTVSCQNMMYASADISTKLLQSSAKKIKEELEKYRAELRKEFNASAKPLTSKMEETVINGITSEAFGVTDEELTKAINQAGITSDMEIPIAIDSTLRKEKHSVIYASFLKNIVQLAQEEHTSCDRKIIDIFLDALHVDTANVFYVELKNKLILFLCDLNLEKGMMDHRGYYKSLVERFSVDLFEILLMLPYGDMSRWTKFDTESANFYSLAMFDSSFEIAITPDKQSLHYVLLFHDQSLRERPHYLKDATDLLEALIGEAIGDKTSALLKQLVKRTGKQTVDSLEKMFLKLDRGKPIENKREAVCNLLESELNFSGRTNAIDQIVLTKESYEDFFTGKRGKTSEIIRGEINQDIDFLHDTLLSAVVYAIQIEKPFLALEFQTIENIIRSLESEEYRAFLVQNMGLIAADKYHEMEAQEQKRLTHIEIISEIELILNEMKE